MNKPSNRLWIKRDRSPRIYYWNDYEEVSVPECRVHFQYGLPFGKFHMMRLYTGGKPNNPTPTKSGPVPIGLKIRVKTNYAMSIGLDGEGKEELLLSAIEHVFDECKNRTMDSIAFILPIEDKGYYSRYRLMCLIQEVAEYKKVSPFLPIYIYGIGAGSNNKVIKEAFLLFKRKEYKELYLSIQKQERISVTTDGYSLKKKEPVVGTNGAISDNAKEFLKEYHQKSINPDFGEYFKKISFKYTDAYIAERSFISASYIHKLKEGEADNISKKKAFSLAIGLHLSYKEAIYFMKLAGFILLDNDTDNIFMNFCLQRGYTSMLDVNNDYYDCFGKQFWERNVSSKKDKEIEPQKI